MPPLSIKRLLRKTFRAPSGPLRSRKLFRPARLTPSLGRHAAALRAVAASAATRQTANANQAPATAAGPSTEGPPMSNETPLTITGNLVDDPELRFTLVSRGFGITEEPFAANSRVAVPRGRV